MNGRLLYLLCGLVLTAGLLEGCGDDDSAAPQATSSTSPSSAPSTTTIPEDGPESTPWKYVEIPEPPDVVLFEQFDDSVVIDDAVRLVFDLEGPIDGEDLEERLRDVLELMGLEVLDGGARVAVDVRLTARRHRTKYTAPSGETVGCWNGYDLDGWVVVKIGGDTAAAHEVGVEVEAPDAMPSTHCDGVEDAVRAWGSIAEALRHFFGLPASLATEALRSGSITATDPAVTDAILATLFHPDDRMRAVAVGSLEEDLEDVARLPAYVNAPPVLIAAFDHYSEQGWPTDSLRNVLRGFYEIPAGFDEHCPAHWWLLWTESWVPSAPCEYLAAD